MNFTKLLWPRTQLVPTLMFKSRRSNIKKYWLNSIKLSKSSPVPKRIMQTFGENMKSYLSKDKSQKNKLKFNIG